MEITKVKEKKEAGRKRKFREIYEYHSSVIFESLSQTLRYQP